MRGQKLANVSPWLLAAACALLAMIIAVFAVNNYRREKMLMINSLVQQGQTIIRFVTSSALVSLRGNRMNIRMNVWQWTDHVQQVIDSVIEQPGLVFVGLLDENGVVLAGNGSVQVKDVVDSETIELLNGLDREKRITSVYQMRDDEFRNGVFQVASLFYPFDRKNFQPRMMRRGFFSRHHSEEMDTLTRGRNNQLVQQFEELSEKKIFILAELDLREFQKAMRRQLLQILALSVVLLLVGLGGWLSLLTLQGYKGSQTRLRQIREFNDLLVSSLPVGLIATGTDGKVRIYNEAAEKMVGVGAGNVLGMVPGKNLPADLANALARSSAPHSLTPLEVKVEDKERGSKSLLLVALPVIDSNMQYVGNTLLIQDVSQIRELQSEVRRNERLASLGKMAAGVAHELRNPLSSIKGLALLLRAKLENDRKGEETADILVNEVERLNRSIGELLEYARPEKLHQERIMLSDLAAQSIQLITEDLKSAEIDLHTSFEDNETYVFGDIDKLKQVFLNLFLNAIQAVGQNGRIQVDITAEDRRVTFQLDDNGCGLDEESVAKVFDPYFTTKSDGTGLGLAMSAKIIEAHKGTIEFRSRQGVGTSVKVSLPVYQEES